jgi:uncharacterized membrane protein
VPGADDAARAAGGASPGEDVVILAFDTVDDARRAFGALRRLHDAGDIRLSAGAVVGRRTNGRAFALEQGRDGGQGRHPAGRRRPGAGADVTDLLRGPFGVVLASAPDALVGSLVDIADLAKSDRILRCFGVALAPGTSGTIAVVTERRPGAVDGVAARLGADLMRKPRQVVEDALRADDWEPAGRRRRDRWQRRRHR